MRSTILCICVGLLAAAILTQTWLLIPGLGFAITWALSESPAAVWTPALPAAWENEPAYVRDRMYTARRLYVNGSIHWTEFLQRVDAADGPPPDAEALYRPMTAHEKREHRRAKVYASHIRDIGRDLPTRGPTIAEQRADIARYLDADAPLPLADHLDWTEQRLGLDTAP